MIEKTPNFPASWIVLAPVAPFIVGAFAEIADRAGVVMDVHNTSVAGHIVLGSFVITILLAAVIEAGAIGVGIIALAKSPKLRSAKNALCLVFGVAATVSFVIAMSMR